MSQDQNVDTAVAADQDKGASTETQAGDQAKAPKAAKAVKPAKQQRIRSLVGRFVILHTNTVIGEGEEKKVAVDDWVQAQINAGKLEVVVD